MVKINEEMFEVVNESENFIEIDPKRKFLGILIKPRENDYLDMLEDMKSQGYGFISMFNNTILFEKITGEKHETTEEEIPRGKSQMNKGDDYMIIAVLSLAKIVVILWILLAISNDQPLNIFLSVLSYILLEVGTYEKTKT